MSTTVTAPEIPRTPAARLRWTLADGWTVTLRDLGHWARKPGQVVAGLLFPVMIVLMFGYLFGGGMAVPGGGDYREYLMPGMYAMTMLFGIEATFTAVARDAAQGVTDRFRSLPIGSSAVVLGRSAADMLNTVLGLAVMIACGLAVGWRWHEGPARAALAIGLLLLLRFAFLWVGIYLGLTLGGPEAVMAVQVLVWPVGFVSSAFAWTGTMPGWLAAVAEWNPLSATMAATRGLFGNPGAGGTTWISEHAGVMALVWPLLLISVFLPLSVRRYRRLDH
ncbi:ABC transporter permease [Microbispora hainanensis]|jgi:ABC-type transport system involved in cytochrome c biogenesis permease component|uniref:Transport permease protein n=1 Tax=Microbispora hainanensis TaxID=568844 RepID=A0ABZ1SXA6_9ACTN|nr:ABC transporter permease [Microbispora hainanensis]